MPRMPTFEEIRADFLNGVRTAEQHIEHPFHHAADAAPQAPAPQPATMTVATAAAATPQEDQMSLFDDAESIYAGAKNELAKFEQALPGVLAKAKAFEASPFAQIAEKAASTVLPPEAVTIAVNAADKVLDDLIGLYGPATPATDPAQAAGMQQAQETVPAGTPGQ